jgi:hypothetical protein
MMPALLTAPSSNPKVAKNEKVGVLASVLHLAPANLSGYEVCPGRSDGCTAACLHYAGNPMYFNVKTAARVRKTKQFFEDRDTFMAQLVKEVAALERKAKKENMEPAVRLNGTSDIVWERKPIGDAPNIMSLFPDVQFYDYTKLPRDPEGLPDNYHLTVSLSESNQDKVDKAIAWGYNIAVVFENKLPETYLGLPVINGDEHDFRPVDPKGCIVGLVVKGPKGKTDDSGFVIRL